MLYIYYITSLVLAAYLRGNRQEYIVFYLLRVNSRLDIISMGAMFGD